MMTHLGNISKNAKSLQNLLSLPNAPEWEQLCLSYLGDLELLQEGADVMTPP